MPTSPVVPRSCPAQPWSWVSPICVRKTLAGVGVQIVQWCPCHRCLEHGLGGGIWACVLGLVLSMWTAALRQPAWAILTPRGCWEMEAVHSSCVIGCRSSPFISLNTGVLTSTPVIDRRCPEASSCQSFESQIEMMYSVACFIYHLRWQKCSVHLFSLWTRVPKPSVCVSDEYIQASRMSILDT